jgi:hypothetical protein
MQVADEMVGRRLERPDLDDRSIVKGDLLLVTQIGAVELVHGSEPRLAALEAARHEQVSLAH